MKKLLLFALGILLVPVLRSSAQDKTTTNTGDRPYMYVGPVMGVGSSWVGNVPGASTSAILSGYAGVNMIMMYKHWGWGDQLIMSSEGYTANYVNGKVSDIPTYLRMPMRGYYFFGDRSSVVRPDIYLGPSFGWNVAEHTSTNYYVGDMSNLHSASNFNTFDMGIDGGVGVLVRVAKNVNLNFDLGFYDGLTDALKTPSNTYSPNRNTDMTMGVLFGIK